MEISKVRKRDGRIVSFNKNKIKNAIHKAFLSVGKEDEEKLNNIVEQIAVELEKKYDGNILNVEEIQDTVEEILIKNNLADVAKSYILYRQKRKEIREAKSVLGVEDDLKLPINSLKVLKARYLKKNEKGEIIETPKQLFKRVANAVAEADKKYGYNEEEIKKTARKFYNLMANLEFIPNSPTLFNAGANNDLSLSACFVLPVPDSIEGIFDAVKNMAIVQKSGGGTGFSFSRLRPKNDIVHSTMGQASGPISFMRVFNITTEVIKQGGKRRGANMGILRVDHPDILEFISCKENEKEITNFNLSVGVTDKFMECVEKGEDYELINPRTKEVAGKLNARKVFSLIATFAWKNGDPGLVFLDEINRHNPTPEREMEATNPCITGDTFISTERGFVKMKDLVEKYPDGGLKIATDNRVPIEIADKRGNIYLMQRKGAGISFNQISRAFCSGIKKVYKLITESGYELEATGDHKILTTEGWVETKNCLNKKILIQSGEGKFNNNPCLPFCVKNTNNNLPKIWSKELGQVLGRLIGNGWLRDKDNYCVEFTFLREDKEEKDYFKNILVQWCGFDIREVEEENGVCHLFHYSRKFVEFFKKLGVKSEEADKREVPNSIFIAPKEAVIGFLQGLFSANGSIEIYEPFKNHCIGLTSKSEKLLKGVQLLLLNLGIKSRICNGNEKSRKNLFRYNIKNEEIRKSSTDDILFELIIGEEDIPIFLEKVGFLCKRKEKIQKPNGVHYSDKFEERVAKVEFVGKKKVYDLTEPFSHSMICQGIITHNCGEQPLLPYESCNLGSINLSKMVKKIKERYEIDWKKLKETVEVAVHFLDNVIDINTFPIKEIDKATKANRKIGLGVMGFADLLILLRVPYNSEKAEEIASNIMKFITETGRNKSRELGREKGNFPNFKKSIWRNEKYMRNATVTTIAPTGTIGIIANCSAGVEPLFAISYMRNVANSLGENLVETNQLFEKILRERDLYNEEIIRKVAGKASIQNIKEIPEDIRRIFVSAHDISPEWHLRIQAAFQKYTDNAVSKTINLPNSATIQDVEKIYMLAWKMKCKGITIYRDGSREEQVINFYSNGKKEERESDDDTCPNCGAKMVREEGCKICRSCGYSACG